MQNTTRCWAFLAACGFMFALGAAAVRAEMDDRTIDLSASDKKVQVWRKSTGGPTA